MVKVSLQKVVKLASDCSVLFITKTYTGFIKFYDMESNTLVYALNEFIVIYRKILQIILVIDTIFIIINLFLIIKFQGLLARQPHLCKNIPHLVCYLDIYGC